MAKRIHLAGVAVLTLVSVATGCTGGDGGGTPQPSPSPTSSPDPGTPTPAPTPTPSTIVRVFDASGDDPIEGAVVVFHDADGSVIDTVTTDSNGEAAYTTTVEDGMISVAWSSPATRRRLDTVVGVVPGDVISFRDYGNDVTNLGTMTFDLPVNALATSYRVDTTCTDSTGASPLSHTITVYEYCLADDGTLDVAAYALDAMGVVVGVALLTDVPFVSGGTNDGIAAWTEPSTSDFSVALADDWTSFGAELYLVHGTSGLFGRASGSGTPLDTLSLAYPPGTGVVHTRTATLTAANGDVSTVTDTLASAEPTIVLTGPEFLPVAEQNAPDTTDPERPIFSWTGYGEAWQLIASRDSGATLSFTWKVTTNATAVQFPELPEELAEWEWSYFLTSESDVVVSADSDIAEWGDFRSRPASLGDAHAGTGRYRESQND